MYPQIYPNVPPAFFGQLQNVLDSIDVKKPAFKRVSEDLLDFVGLL